MRLPFIPRTRPTLTASARPKREERSGQALVEFSLILAPFLLIIFGIIQMGLLFSTQLGLSTAARDSARYASTLMTTSSTQATTNGTIAYSDLRTVRLPQYVIAYSDSNLVTSGIQPTSISYCQYQNSGSPTTWSIRVRALVEYRQVLLLPLVSILIDGLDGTNDSKFRVGTREELRVEGPGLKASPAGIPACCACVVRGYASHRPVWGWWSSTSSSRCSS
jgi:Flp pilus assembly protein TadG